MKRSQRYRERAVTPDEEEVNLISSRHCKKLRFENSTNIVDLSDDSHTSIATDKSEKQNLFSPKSPDMEDVVDDFETTVVIPLSPITSAWGYETQPFCDDSAETVAINMPDSNTLDGFPEHCTPSPTVSSLGSVTEVYAPRAWKNRFSPRFLKKALSQVLEGYTQAGTFLEIGGIRTKVFVCHAGNIHLKPAEDEENNIIDLDTLHFNFTVNIC